MRFVASPERPFVYFHNAHGLHLAIVERSAERGPPFIAFSHEPRRSGCGETSREALRELHKQLRLTTADPFGSASELGTAALALQVWDRIPNPFHAVLVGPRK